MAKPDELKQARMEQAHWEEIFKPLGCILVGWSYKSSAQVRLPSGRYLSIDGPILELINCAKAAGRKEGASDYVLMLRALADIKRHLGLEGVEDLRRQADEMEKRTT